MIISDTINPIIEIDVNKIMCLGVLLIGWAINHFVSRCSIIKLEYVIRI